MRDSHIIFLLILMLVLVIPVPVSADQWVSYNNHFISLVNNETVEMWNATGIGTFVATGNISTTTSVMYVVVGGGGGGGYILGGGGGGAGAYWANNITGLSGIINLSVGSGGAASTSTSTNGGNGQNSTFYNSTPSNITAMGGSGGGTRKVAITSGGSTGGGGSMNTPSSYLVQELHGRTGGAGYNSSSTNYQGGGGGGLIRNGSAGTSSKGGDGGMATKTTITGGTLVLAGGGGGGMYTNSAAGRGLGGNNTSVTVGGSGAYRGSGASAPNASSGSGGGGGGSTGTPSAGASGIVIIRYASHPHSTFTSNVTSGTPPTVVQFNDTSTNTSTSWNWSFQNVTGNNTEVWFSTVQNATYTFGVGNWSIHLNATNMGGSEISSDTVYINVSVIPAPVSSFTTDITSGTAPLSVQFTDTSTNSPTSWNWTFQNVTGNNTRVLFSSLEDPSYTFGVGNWSIKHNATNAGGVSVSTQITYINVSAALPKPVASFNQNVTSGTAPTDVAFTDTSTNSPTSWAWYFGDEDYNEPWVLQNASGGWVKRQNPVTVTLTDGSLLTMSGADGVSVYYNDTMRSTDKGVTWQLQNASSGWSGRQGSMAVALSDGSIIIAGGQITGGASSNDTWRSTDKGVTWVRQNASSGWSKRFYAKSVVMSNDNIIIMGGYDNDPENVVYNDTWRSTDKGVTWTRVNASSGWGIRRNFEAVVLPDDSIVLFGGRNASTGIVYNDTWRSTDQGSTWTRQSANAAWVELYGMTGVTMPDGSIVFLGGTTGSSTQENVFRSTNKGITWSLINTTGISYRYLSSSTVASDGSMIVVGGVASASALQNDTWRFNPVSSTSQNPEHTYTSAGNYSIVLVASNANGYNQTVPYTHWVNITSAGTAPVAGFSSNVTSGTAPLSVQFTDSSTNTPTAWNWSYNASNMLPYSQTFPFTSWYGNEVVLTSGYTAPDGSLTATKMTPNDSYAQHYIGYNANINDTGTHTLSAYFKDAGYHYGRLGFNNNNLDYPGAVFNLSDGTIYMIDTGIKANITYVGNGWYRGSITNTTVFANRNIGDVIMAYNNSPNNYYYGDTISGVYVWGAQHEIGGNATVYNETTSVAPIRTYFSTSQNPIYTFTIAGNYTVSLNATNSGGSNTTVLGSHWINVSASGPTPAASFTQNVTSGTAPTDVAFTDTSTGSPTGWAWYFGDEDYTEAWAQQNVSSGWHERVNSELVTMPDGSIVLMGGDPTGNPDAVNDTWRSTDKGATWTQQNASSGWLARFSHSSVSLSDGSIVLMGGKDASTTYNDTWRSTDNGATWVRQNTSGGWVGRYGMASVALSDDSILLFGGSDKDYNHYNDVWKSTNKGVSWTRINSSAGWSIRGGHVGLKTSNGNVFVIGGGDATPKNDTWLSTDSGVTWVQQSINAGWRARVDFSGWALPDNSIMIGGGTNGTRYNDTWRSTDNGVTWTQVNASNAWTARGYTAGTILPDGSIIILGGDDGTYLKNDTWRMQLSGSTTQSPEHTYTSAGNYSIVLVASNANGYNQTVPYTHWVNVTATAAGPIPAASFTQNVTSGVAPTDVAFTDTSTGSPATWRWYFGDENWTQDPWILVNSSNGWATRQLPVTVTLTDGSILLYGGWDGGSNYYNDTWRSTDNGSTWVQQNASSGWRARKGSSGAALLDGSAVIIGGSDSSGNFYNDTWRSTDKGVTWTRVNQSGGWTPRGYSTASTLSDGSVVIMGGVGWNGDDQFFNDTWRSTNNGTTWTRMNASSGWVAKCSLSSSALPDGSVVLVGGTPAWGTYTNDTWRSTDNGATWTRVNATGWVKRGGAAMATMPDGSILVLAGSAEAIALDDVWRSTDKGTTWTQINSSFNGLTDMYYFGMTVTADGSVVVTGGNTDNTYRFNPYGSTTQSPTHTYSSAGNYSITLRVNNTNGYNNSALYTHWVNVTATAAGPIPVASFTQNVTSGVAPTDVAFTDTSTGTPTNWSWYFGDENWTQDPWILINSSSGWAKRSAGGLVSLPDGSVLYIGGADNSGVPSYNDTWRSTNNGSTWTRVNQSGGWQARFWLSTTSLSNGHVILTSGRTADGTYLNDVWKSSDSGSTWTLVNSSPGWSVTSQNGLIDTNNNTLVFIYGNYTYRSLDEGSTWTLLTPTSSPYQGRSGFGLVPLSDGSIVLMGGDTDGGPVNDTWRSTDQGATWTQMNASGGWEARFEFAVTTMPDDSIILMGGTDGSDEHKDMWRSTNKGSSWQLVNTSAAWSTGYHYARATTTTDGTVVMAGLYDGIDSRNYTYRYNPSGSLTQNPTHTYSSAGNYSIVLVASNINGYNQTAPYTRWVNVTSGATAPVVSFTQNVTSGSTPLPVQFNDTSTNTPTSWNWSYNTSNLVPYSQQFSSGSWYTEPGVTKTLNATIAPDGTMTATRLQASATDKSVQQSGISVLPNTNYTFSEYVKNNNGNGLLLVIYDDTNAGIITTVGYDHLTLSRDWARYNVTFKTASNTQSVSVYPFYSLSTGEITDVYIWGTQLERGNTTTQYVVTNATAPITSYFSTSKNSTYTFTTTGNYSIYLNATNAGGSSINAWNTHWVNVTSVTAPVALFTPNSTTTYPDQIIKFVDQSSNYPTSWQWNATNITPGNNTAFTFSTSQNPLWTFGEGNWSIQLRVTNGAGTDTDNGWINLSSCNDGINCTRKFYVVYDGMLGNDTDNTFSNMRNAAVATNSMLNPDNYISTQLTTTGSSPTYDMLYRGFTTTNTSGIPDDATITNATFTATSYWKYNALASPNASIIDFEPTNPISVTYSDYSKTKFVRYANDVPYASIGTTPGNTTNFTLNSAAIANISKTGYTTFMLTSNFDTDNTAPAFVASSGTPIYWCPISSGSTYNYCAGANESLTVNYTKKSAPVASFTSNVTSGTAPLPVQFNDTSTNAPTSWNWSYYNGLNIIDPNLANGTESGSTSPFSVTSGAMATSNTTYAWQGTRSLRVNTTSSQANEGMTAGSTALFPLLSNTPYTASFYLKGESGGESVTVRFTEYDNSGYVIARNNAITLTNDWMRYNVTGTTTSSTTRGYLSVLTTGTSSYVWFVDGIQFEIGSASTPWQLPATTTPTYFSTLQNASYTFSQPGNFTVTLNASNSGGSNLTSGKYWINVSSSGTMPIVSFTLNKNYLRTPSPITGTNTSICDPACTDWNWSWGDGTYSATQNPTHIYLERGKFLIALNVTNSVGYNLSASQTVRVTGYETYA